MFRCPSSCREPGCRQPSARGGDGFCERHISSNSFVEATRQFDRERWKNDATYRVYHRAPWPQFRAMLLGQNVLCQKLDRDGAQCRNVSTLVHHLISPRVRPELFVDAANCVALCAHCHPPDEGTPHWRPGVDFVPTQFRLPSFGQASHG